jgi:hypothetical protein
MPFHADAFFRGQAVIGVLDQLGDVDGFFSHAIACGGFLEGGSLKHAPVIVPVEKATD